MVHPGTGKDECGDGTNLDILTSFFKAVPDLLFQIDADGVILDYHANDGSELYIPPEAFLGKKVDDVLPPDISALFRENLAKSAASRRTSVFEYDLPLAKGLRRFECRISPVADTGTCLALVRDITEQHAARTALESSEKYFRELLDSVPFPVLIARVRDGSLQYGNRRAEREFRFDRETAKGSRAEWFYRTPADRDRFLDAMRRQGSVHGMEVELFDWEKRPYWGPVSGTLAEFDGEPAIIVAINSIQIQKAQAIELERERRNLQERMKEQKALYEVLLATENIDQPVDEVLRKAVNLLAPAMQFPEIASVALDAAGTRYCTPGFVDTPWMLSVRGEFGQGKALRLTIAYARESPPADEGPFLKEERAFADAVLIRLAGYLDRQDTARAALESEGLVRTMFEQTTDSIALVDPETNRFVTFNRRAHEDLGYSREEFSELSLPDIRRDLSPGDAARIMRDLDGVTPDFPNRHVTRDGTIRDVVLSLRPLIYNGKRLVCGVWRDVTGQKAHEKEQSDHAERLQRYLDLARSLGQDRSRIAGDIEKLAGEAAEKIGETLGYDKVIVRLLDAKSGIYRLVGQYGRAADSQGTVAEVSQERFEHLLEALRTRRFIPVEDIDTHPGASGPLGELARSSGIKALLICGIFTGAGDPAGLLTFKFTDMPHLWGPEEISFGCQVADQFGLTLLTRDRLAAIRDLARSEAYLKHAQEVSQTGHWYLDIATGALSWSDESYRIFGREKGKPLTLQDFLGCIHPDDRERVLAEWNNAMAGAPYDIVHRVLVGNEIKWVEERAEIERDKSGKALSGLGIARDITEKVLTRNELDMYRKHLEELVGQRTAELEAAKVAAEAANQAKSAFLSNMIHEIRTPMNAILGYAHLIKREPLTPRQMDQLAKMSGAADHLLAVINDILDLSKIEASKMRLEVRNFDLAKTVEHVCSLVQDKAAAKSLALSVDLGDFPATLRGDGERFGQVLLNLVSNAVKFTEKGDVRIVGRVLRRDQESVLLRFEIRDTGIGIRESQLKRLFSAFEQADESTTRRFGGTGLGLAISKRLVELMEGRIGVESQAGKGSMFWMELPFRVARDKPSALPDLRSLTGMRVLVVDDSREDRESLAGLVSRIGMRADTAASGKEGLEHISAADLKGDPYGLLIVDWKMRGMDGLEMARRVRSLSLSTCPEFMMVTAWGRDLPGDEPDLDMFARILPKPVTRPIIEDALTGLLERADRPGLRPPGKIATLELGKRSGSRILVVEDNLINQEVTRLLLENAEMLVSTAVNGKVGVEMVSSFPFDLVLMDIQMPVMDGMLATKAIRLLPDARRSGVPIVAMTANAFEEDRRACLQAGMNDHLGKPVDPAKLYEALVRWLPVRHADASAPAVEANAVGVPPVSAQSSSPAPASRVPAGSPGVPDGTQGNGASPGSASPGSAGPAGAVPVADGGIAAPGNEVPGPVATGTPASVMAAVKRLRELLILGDTAVSGEFDSAKRLLASLLGNAATRMERQIHNYEYSAALETLAAALEERGIKTEG